MKLSEIASGLSQFGINIDLKKFHPDTQISGITDNTGQCGKGFIFVCIRGRNFDGHTAAGRMLYNGAAFVVTDHDLHIDDQVIVPDTRKFYGWLVSVWFKHPERQMKFAAITGTNGKTTTASLLAQILVSTGKRTGLIGTTGVFIMGPEGDSELEAPNNTTPPVYELYALLVKMLEDNVTHVVMEVSSFALEQERIGPLMFDVAVFTNLTQDHLDYHGTMENYYEAKLRLFTDHTRASIINTDDSYGLRLFSELNTRKDEFAAPFAYGTAKNCHIRIQSAKLETERTRFRMEAGGHDIHVTTNLVGEYNVYNAAAAIAAANVLGLGIKSVVRAVGEAKGVKGRCEIIPCDRGFTVICDYAHTPDALEKVCETLKKTARGKLIVVFGCGGDRDADKRPKMGKSAQEHADICIVTSDNPRNEDPDDIIDQILEGMDNNKAIVRITDRKAAINHAISIACKDDMVLLAGKGHETYQIFKDGLTLPFDERKIVADMLGRYTAPLPWSGKEGRMRISELAECVNGSMREIKNPAKDIFTSDIFTDTRAPKVGGVYIALRGDNYDGFDFIPAATNAGAAASVTERYLNGYPCIVVKNCRQALLEVAKAHRKQYSPITVAVTGSVGKTTTKDMIALALSGNKTVFKTEGNHNNEIGVPLSLFELNSSHTAAVVEMGMNHAGEISRLSGVVRPDICVITNIGYNHIEFFNSIDDILKAKLEILDGAPRNAPLVINGMDEMLMSAKDYYGRNRKVITYGIGENGNKFDYTAVDIVRSPSRTAFRVMKNDEYISDVELFISGSHNILNALAAVTVADIAGVDTGTAGQMLGCFQPAALRQHIEKRGHNTLIVDCYNASPSSMEASLKMLAEMPVKPGARRVAVLGDMLETGEHAKELHEKVGEMVVANGIDLLVCYGASAKYIAKRADELGMHSGYSADKNVVKNFLKFKLKPEDIILFKASRGIHMENLIDEYFGNI